MISFCRSYIKASEALRICFPDYDTKDSGGYGPLKTRLSECRDRRRLKSAVCKIRSVSYRLLLSSAQYILLHLTRKSYVYGGKAGNADYERRIFFRMLHSVNQHLARSGIYLNFLPAAAEIDADKRQQLFALSVFKRGRGEFLIYDGSAGAACIIGLRSVDVTPLVSQPYVGDAASDKGLPASLPSGVAIRALPA